MKSLVFQFNIPKNKFFNKHLVINNVSVIVFKMSMCWFSNKIFVKNQRNFFTLV